MKDVFEVQTWIDKFGEEQLNVDELKDYLEFVQSAEKSRDSNRYSEWHHVMPKCIDKEKEYVKYAHLNGADHFRAHLKLVECFVGDCKRRLCFALSKMLGHLKEEITPEDYEEARKLNSEALRGNQNAKGYRHTEESRKLMSQKHRDCDTEETKQKRSQSLKGHKVSQETRDKIRQTLKGVKPSDSAIKASREYWTGRKHTEETLKRMSEAQSGEHNAMYGKHHTEETRAKMSVSRQGNQNAKGNIWITNGISNKIVRDLCQVPAGWYRGRTVKKKGDCVEVS